MPAHPPLIALNGPTASGKTQLAIRLALQLIDRGHPAEIVNSDAMVVYRGMDIGTAKPTPEERQAVPHHLVDVAEVWENPSVARFQRQARDVIAEVRARGAIPVLVGGSALYTRAILDHFDFPGTDEAVRRRFEDRLELLGAEALHAELAQRAPAVAAQILPGNARRVVRALEVLELTGSYQPALPSWRYALDDVHQWGLQIDRSVLDQRIETRVDRMWAAGLVDEVRRLEPDLRRGRTAAMALGYRQILAFLAGEMSESEARAATITGTRRFARKQLSWFRRDERIRWCEVPVGSSTVGDQNEVSTPLETLAEQLAEQIVSIP